VDGAKRQLDFAPHLPANWDKVTLRRIRVGESVLTLDLTQAEGEMALHINNDGAPVKLAFDPELPLGARVRDASLVQNAQDTHAHVAMDLPRGESVVRVGYSGGVSIVPPTPRPLIGERSRGMKIVGVSLDDRVYTVELDHPASEQSRFELRTPWKIANVQGAKLQALAPSRYSVQIDASADNTKRAYQRSQVIVTFGSVD
jgi:hypothetical protein